ncbi:MAG TPA: hypothetical protein VHY30_01530 [Verrucomicrobiae bacterium]|nr:hypothetical protein [Verrucomicrobiae bacterium]
MKNKLKLHIAVFAGICSALWHRATKPDGLALANYLASPASDEDTKLSDAAITRRCLIKLGTDENHINVCGTGDIPLGATRDGSCLAAAINVSYAQFGLYSRELEGIASGAIAAGDMIVPGAAGAVRTLPAVGGTYYIIGRAKTAAADGQPVVYVPCFPVQRIV